MIGILSFVSAFDPRIKLRIAMIAFVPADDPLWDKIVEIHDQYRIEIDSIKHHFGPISDLELFRANKINKDAKILVVEFDGKVLPVHHDDCLLITGQEEGKVIEFEEVEYDIESCAILL